MSIHIRRLPVGIVGYAHLSFPISLSFFRALPLALTFVSSFIAVNGQNAGVTGAKYGSLASPAELGISNLDNDVVRVPIGSDLMPGDTDSRFRGSTPSISSWADRVSSHTCQIPGAMLNDQHPRDRLHCHG